MVKVKHFLDRVEADDGYRMWVEPFGLTRDLQEVCRVAYCMKHIAPPMELWTWFEQHPEGYEYFRGQYHGYLDRRVYGLVLSSLAAAASEETLTLLHQEEDTKHNTATALAEFLSELAQWKYRE